MQFRCMKMSQYFPQLFRSFGGNINIKVDLSNCARKTDLKNVTHVDTSNFAPKTNLASLKTEVDKLEIDKLAPVPADLSKLGDVVKNDVVKKTVCDKLAANVNNIDTSDFVLKSKYQTDKKELGKKITDLTDFVKKTKLIELENKVPDVSSLATKTALTAVKNKTPSISSLVKKRDYNTKITEIEKKLSDHNHDKYITAPELIVLIEKLLDKSKKLLVENELKKLKTFDSSYFIAKSHFEEDVTQNYLVFQPMYRYFKRVVGVGTGSYIYFSKSKGLSKYYSSYYKQL